MAIKFNPLTGNFDFTGSGGGGGSSYIDGEVQNFSALPTSTPPDIDAAYLVREAEGTWLLNRKPAGIYIRTDDTGVRADDWTHAGAFPDVFNDANFLIYDNDDSSKNLAFQLSGITTGTTRTLTVPNSSGTISLTGHTHAASDITSGVLDFDRIQQVLEVEIDGTEGTPTEVDLTTNMVGGNLHALVVLLGADTEAYSKVILPALGAAATGKVTVRVNEFEDASDDFVQIVLDDDTAIFPASSYAELDPDEEITFRWNNGRWDLDLRPNPAATTAVSIFKPNASGTLVISSTTGIAGADAVTNIVSLTQAEYNAIGSPDAATLFLITDP